MKVDVSFEFAKVYDINKIDVVVGQKFSVLTDYQGESIWASTNDPVLKLEVTGNNAIAEATAKGQSIIYIMNASEQVQKKITINVVDAIVEPATDLNPSADQPIVK